ncbi:MAG: sulfurtransferase TusA family protein [Planctomycetota bacterium]|jgi:tRNA 2-thiouridine synthesizing protein A
MMIAANATPVRSADLTGEVCPMTFVKLKLHLEQVSSGEVIEVLLKDGEHMRNVPRSVKAEGHRIVNVASVEGGLYRLLIVKGGGGKGPGGDE